MRITMHTISGRATTLNGIAAAACVACCVQGATVSSPGQLTRVVVVRSKEVEPFKQAEAAFTLALSSETQIQSLSLAEATPEVLAKAAEDLNTAFFAIGSEAAENVKLSIGVTSPFTCAMVSDPQSLGIFNDRATTLVSMDTPAEEQVKLISVALPYVRKIGVLYRSDTPKGRRAIEGLRAALPHGWALDAIAVEKEASVSEALTRMFNMHPDLVWTYADSTLYDVATIKSLLLESLRKNVPVFGFSAAFVRAGAIIGVGTTPTDQGRQAAAALSRAPGIDGDGNDLVIPPELKTYVNTVVAERLEISLPEAVIQSATTVFKGE